jgi:uncharacterized RDD family membrane protein YckC
VINKKVRGRIRTKAKDSKGGLRARAMRPSQLWRQDNPALLPARMRNPASPAIDFTISNLQREKRLSGAAKADRQAQIAARTESFQRRRLSPGPRWKEPHEGTLGALSTQPTLTPQWKEEVNRRLAAHKSRRGQSAASETTQNASLGSSRAAQAAARVAARFANAPSYSELQAEGARVAVRAAEIATKVALEAQAVAETALAEMHAAAAQAQSSRGPAVVQPITQPVRLPEIEAPADPAPISDPFVEQAAAVCGTGVEAPLHETSPAVEVVAEQQPEPRRFFGIRWDPDLPKPPAERKSATRRGAAREEFELSVEDWWSPAEVAETLRNNPIEVSEPDQEHANLIQFPRELVATRKIRPHPGPATDAEAQLSIFEVDPATVSTEAAAPGAVPDGAGSIWNRPEWSGIKLDKQPVGALASAREADPALAALPVASLGTRLMATAVDCALILAGFVSVGFLVAHNVQHPPAGKPAELLGAGALALIGMLYYAFFFAMPVSTPGMMYAGIGLCTFDEKSPTRAQLRRRLGAMVLSLLPVGLGLVWSIFDEDHLSWHDRFSQTYLRKL